MAFVVSIFFICAIFIGVDCYIIRPGPQVEATEGEVWPKPKQQEFFDEYYILSPTFEFEVNPHYSCKKLSSSSPQKFS